MDWCRSLESKGGSADCPCTPSFTTQISDKRIYVFGGHINWRNKLKAAYPTLIIMDGHNQAISKTALLNADMVLLNTKNMSHNVYYKVVDVLRKNKVPFGYIGKYTNTRMLEHEISATLRLA